MHLIAHRGNINGRNPERENTVEYLQEALDAGFHVEVDVFSVHNDDGKKDVWLGHDSEGVLTTIQFLMNDHIWVHAKNVSTFNFLTRYSSINSFYHERDLVALTTSGYLWHSDSSVLYYDRSIAMIPDSHPHQPQLKRVAGVCSDYIKDYDYLRRPNDLFKSLIIDVDGVLSKNKTYDLSGDVMSKDFCDRDFTAIKRFKAAGINVCFLSGDQFNEGIAKARNIPFIYARDDDPSIIDKSTKLDLIFEEFGWSKKEIAYIGDDYYDITLLEQVGTSFCPSDSPQDVQKVVTHILTTRGGEGCIAEIFDIFSDQLNKAYPYDNL